MNIRALLGVLLTVQVALAAGLFLRDSHGGASIEPLLGFAVANVDRIVINDQQNTATLRRSDTGWELAGLPGLPANATRIDALLEALDKLRTSWPVVQSAAGRERFEVTEQNYQRRLQLYQDDVLLGEYYFGTSPGFRQTHARRADDDAVYALAFSNFDLPGDNNDWLDKTLLSTQNPQQITGPDFTIAKAETQWQLADATGTDVRLNQEEVTELVNAFSGLRVLRAEEPAQAAAQVQFSVGNAAGVWEYQFSSSDGKYYVKRSDRQHAFTISQADYERITGKRRDEIVNTNGATEAPAPADGNSDENV